MAITGPNLESLKIVSKSNPKIVNKNDLLIKIKAASLNYRDLIMVSGGYGKHQQRLLFLFRMVLDY